VRTIAAILVGVPATTYHYVLQDESGYVGILEQSSADLRAGSVVTLTDGREALVVARTGAGRGSRFTAILEVVVAQVPPPPTAR